MEEKVVKDEQTNNIPSEITQRNNNKRQLIEYLDWNGYGWCRMSIDDRYGDPNSLVSQFLLYVLRQRTGKGYCVIYEQGDLGNGFSAYGIFMNKCPLCTMWVSRFDLLTFNWSVLALPIMSRPKWNGSLSYAAVQSESPCSLYKNSSGWIFNVYGL